MVRFNEAGGATAKAVAIGSRGRITAVGEVGGGTIGLARLMPAGALDRSFSQDGRISTRLGGDGVSAADVALTRTAGTLVAGAGRERSELPYGFTLAQFRRGGSVDRGFGRAGVRYTYLRGSSAISQIAIDRRGRIVAAGYSSADSSGGDSAFAVVRYTARGNLDRSFSGDGKLLLRVGGRPSQARAVAIDAEGKILVGGVVAAGRRGSFALVRFTPRGRLDTSFSGDGAIMMPAMGRCHALCPNGLNDLALDRRGRIVAAGDSIVARYTAGGGLDRTFSGDGVLHVSDFGAAAVTLDHRQRIVIAGNTGGRAPIDFAVLRLLPRGAPDTAFGDGLGVQVEYRFLAAWDVAIDRRGRVVAVGKSEIHRPTFDFGQFAFARYVSD